jgi:hypothetical protein
MPKTTPTPHDPILHEPTTLIIAGNEYTLRRLGLRDVFKVSRILGRGIAALGERNEQSPTQVLEILIASLNESEDDVLKLISDLLNVPRKTLDDPALFPIDSFIDIITAIAANQDLRSFFVKVQALTSGLP